MAVVRHDLWHLVPQSVWRRVALPPSDYSGVQIREFVQRRVQLTDTEVDEVRRRRWWSRTTAVDGNSIAGIVDKPLGLCDDFA